MTSQVSAFLWRISWCLDTWRSILYHLSLISSATWQQLLYVHRSATTLKAPTDNDHLSTYSILLAKLWILTSMWIPLDTNHLSNHVCRPSPDLALDLPPSPPTHTRPYSCWRDHCHRGALLRRGTLLCPQQCFGRVSIVFQSTRMNASTQDFPLDRCTTERYEKLFTLSVVLLLRLIGVKQSRELSPLLPAHKLVWDSVGTHPAPVCDLK